LGGLRFSWGARISTGGLGKRKNEGLTKAWSEKLDAPLFAGTSWSQDLEGLRSDLEKSGEEGGRLVKKNKERR